MRPHGRGVGMDPEGQRVSQTCHHSDKLLEKATYEGRICLGTQPKRFQPEVNWVCCSGPVEHMVEAHGAQETDPEKESEDVRCVRMSQWCTSSTKATLPEVSVSQ